jgi:murein DD-endopeptidase MepM/ murein hydrolase activator NlpD
MKPLEHGRLGMTVARRSFDTAAERSAGPANRFRWRRRLIAALAVMWMNASADRLMAQQPLPISKGVYRLPYATGTEVRILQDHFSHSPSRNRIDMAAQGTGPFVVVAAAAGCIRRIVDSNDTFCPNACQATTTTPENDCNGNGTTTQFDHCNAQNIGCAGYAGPSGNCCERHVPANSNCPPFSPVPACTTFCPGNNYVWIEHPNGEWTKYTHMLFGSVTAMGRFEGECVAAGTPLGFEGDVGFATTPHVHFEVAVPNYIEGGTVGDYISSGGFLVVDGVVDDLTGDGVDNVNRQNRIPVFCSPTGGTLIPAVGLTTVVEPCNGLCGTNSLQLNSGTLPNGTVFYRQAGISINTGNFVVQAFAGVSLKAGNRITLSPGFRAEEDAYFSASIGPCDTPGNTTEAVCCNMCTCP